MEKVMTKKVIRFLVKKSAPPEKILATPMHSCLQVWGPEGPKAIPIFGAPMTSAFQTFD